ncbi:MAG: DUF6531 domain-containing protein, partial [Pseudomonadota bacterium]|nr:DUF6531 domain-containing protein [Pseudomonadota bacterium]
MKSIKNALAIFLLLFFWTPFASAAGACTQNGGDLSCTNPKRPEWTGDWIYWYTDNHATRYDFSSWQAAFESYTAYMTAVHGLKPTGDYQLDHIYGHAYPPPHYLLDGPRSQAYSVTGQAWHPRFPDELTTYSGSIAAVRPYSDWECPVGTKAVDQQGASAPPFFCAAETPPKPSPCSGSGDSAGNPCSITTGHKYQREQDYQAPIGYLSLQRMYDSRTHLQTDALSMAAGWVHQYQKRIRIRVVKKANWEGEPDNLGNPLAIAVLDRGDGTQVFATRQYTDSTIANSWFIDRDLSLRLERNDNSWTLTQLKTGVKEHYWN